MQLPVGHQSIVKRIRRANKNININISPTRYVTYDGHKAYRGRYTIRKVGCQEMKTNQECIGKPQSSGEQTRSETQQISGTCGTGSDEYEQNYPQL